jgi:hypothetical protein
LSVENRATFGAASLNDPVLFDKGNDPQFGKTLGARQRVDLERLAQVVWQILLSNVHTMITNKR